MAIFGSIMKPTSSSQYRPLSSDSEKGEEDESSLSDLRPLPSQRSNIFTLFPWVLTLLFASVSVYQYVTRSPFLGTFEKGWKTDFGPIREAVAIEESRFSGGASFTETGDYLLTQGDVKYFGTPSPEIDHNWDELTWGRYILITREEAQETFKDDYGDNIDAIWSPRHGGYYTGFSMFHTLHCVNRLRKAFHPDYYPMDDNPNHITHRDHCFEQIRQYILCAGDLTPVPTIYNHLRDVNYVDSNLKHTCRSFKPIREWVTDRYNGSKAIQPKCPNGTYPSMGKLMCKGH